MTSNESKMNTQDAELNPTISESDSSQPCENASPFKRTNENITEQNVHDEAVAPKRVCVEIVEKTAVVLTSSTDQPVSEDLETLQNASDKENLLDVAKRSDGHPDTPQRTAATSNEKTFVAGKKTSIEWLSGNQKTGVGKIFSENREQFIEGEWKDYCLIKLHYAQFKNGNSEFIRLYALNNLFTSSKHNFVARVMFVYPCKIPYGHFQYFRKKIESDIVITKILDDDLQTKLEHCRDKLKSILKSKQESINASRIAHCDMFQLFLLINEISNPSKYGCENENIVLLSAILKNTLLSQEILNVVKVLHQVETKYNNRNVRIPTIYRIQAKFSWIKYISECINSSIANLKAALIKSLPTRGLIASGAAEIDKLPNHQLFTCTVKDVKLFSGLELSIRQYAKINEFEINMLEEFTQQYINKLWNLFTIKLFQCTLNNVPEPPVHTNTVFLQLIKTFLGIINYVCGARNEEILKVVAISDDADLSIVENPQNTPGIYENRLKFVMSLMNHFKPGDVKKSAFSYELFYFNVNETTFKELPGYDTLVSDIAQEYVIWIYYIHKSFADLFYQKREESNMSELYSFLNPLIELYITAVKKNAVSLDKVRILASSLIEFGTTISPYFLEQTSINENDLSILLQQAKYLKNFVTAYDQTVNDITNTVDIYQVFWQERRPLFTELRTKYSLWPSALDELTEKFNTFIRYVFNLEIYSNKILSLLKAYNDFMRLFRGTNLPWFIQKHNMYSHEHVKFINHNTDSYLVRDVKSFIEEVLRSNLSGHLPRHFLFDLVKNLLNCVEEFLTRSNWEESDKIHAASDLLVLMGRSLINFNRLPNAVDFQHFYAIFTEPFKRVTENSSDIKDFKKRLSSLENYYKYTMELNVMSIGKALQLCKQNYTHSSVFDYNFNFDQLNLGYKIYLDKFDSYVEKYILKTDFNVTQFAEKIVSKAKPLDITKWDSQYKILKLPKLLAGVCAVWSALVSADLISQQQLIKPHCIQILCVLRLLAADKTSCGVDSHLAHVISGQGKSIILSLLAAVLALTGNRVRIVCYNEYLANRDQKEFQTFYSTLKIEDQINYGTFADMTKEVLNPDINGTKYNLPKFLNELITGELPRLHVTEEDTEVSKTVLLFDELDVFFTTEFYGNVYDSFTTIRSEILAELQINIWKVTENNKNFYDIYENIQKYVDEILPQSEDQIFIKIVEDNRTLLNHHIKQMILKAISVRNSVPGDWYSRKFKLSADGLYITVDKSGDHSNISQYIYSNIFMYFKLKKENFEHKNFKNYGYLYVECGNVSYALLPKSYRAILGVTGTIKQFTEVEMRVISSYNIRLASNMPTFFGSNKLKVGHLTIKLNEVEWIKSILDDILSVVQAGRAVIVFFADEHIIAKVRCMCANNLSQFSVLTGNESAEEIKSCVEEAGNARKVTITTRKMGRGVDFKSNDSSVEDEGGMHVIQTFWSEDVKEEKQIKGRTARKDNSGSYKTILCREHISKAGYDALSRGFYELNEARRRRAERKGAKTAQKIKQSQEKHDATMDFIKSLYDYNPEKRQEYFKKYPFVDFSS